MAFRVGQKVVCIFDFKTYTPTDLLANGVVNAPEIHKVYTVREITNDPKRGEFVRLEEVINPQKLYTYGYHEQSFLAGHFRPVVERGTDVGMSMLRSLLNDQRVPA